MNSTGLRYIHQDHLSGTSVITDTNGASVGTMKYHPYGSTRSGSVPTDKKFTGQRLDGTGLYYYNARYYDPTIGRFISADSTVSRPANPQSLNRYTYVLNNPLKYIDPTGHDLEAVESGTDIYGDTIYYVYDDNGDFVGAGPGLEGIEAIYDFYVEWNDLSYAPPAVTFTYHYSDDKLGKFDITVHLIPEKGSMASTMDRLGIGAFAFAPIGIFMRWDQYDLKDKVDMADFMELLNHESYHYAEQQYQGPVGWQSSYWGEILGLWVYYGDYWKGAYNMHSKEIAAREAAGQDRYWAGGPTTTHWWDNIGRNIYETLWDPWLFH